MQDPNYPDILIDNPDPITLKSDLSDSHNHTAYYNIMLYVLGEPFVDSRYLYYDAETGYARRHPDRELNSSTRDQNLPSFVMQGLMIHDNRYTPMSGASCYRVSRFYKMVKRNWGFFFNSVGSDGLRKKPWWDRDWLDPQTRGVWARATGTKRWMHYVADLNLLFTMLLNELTRPNKQSDENIHAMMVLQKLVHPTFIGRICHWFYFTKTRMDWREKIVLFFDRDGRYYPEIPPVAIKALEKLQKEPWK